MPYIIDGHNLIAKLRGLDLSAENDEQQLVERLQVFCLKRGKTAEVYFDKAPFGSKERVKTGKVTAIFVRSGSTADSAIHRRLSKIGGSVKNYWVVSSDHRVQQSAKEFHARSISSEEFAELMEQMGQDTAAPDEGPEAVLDEEEVEKWLKIFRKKPG
jgi:predicted RNA-binding protein with PIN domain